MTNRIPSSSILGGGQDQGVEVEPCIRGEEEPVVPIRLCYTAVNTTPVLPGVVYTPFINFKTEILAAFDVCSSDTTGLRVFNCFVEKTLALRPLQRKNLHIPPPYSSTTRTPPANPQHASEGFCFLQ